MSADNRGFTLHIFFSLDLHHIIILEGFVRSHIHTTMSYT